MTDYLAAIVARKRDENRRRRRFVERVRQSRSTVRWTEDEVIAGLRRGDRAPRVIAEIKFRSPSAGEIRPRALNAVADIAEQYEAAGASVVSVLADGPGFGGTPLDVRRASAVLDVPVLYKEFVLEALQLDLARAMGSTVVLLLVRCLADIELKALVEQARGLGLTPLLEAHGVDEVDRAVACGGRCIGVNTRNLSTFLLDREGAVRAIERVPRECAAIWMSGVSSHADYLKIAGTRADAVLVGEHLMRAARPGDELQTLLLGT